MDHTGSKSLDTKTESEEVFQKLTKILDDLQSKGSWKCEGCGKDPVENVENGHSNANTKNLESINSELKQQIEELKYELTKKNKMKEEMKILKEELEKQAEGEPENERLKAEIENLKSKFDELTLENVNLASEKEAANSKCEQTDQLLTEKIKEIEQLTDENEELREKFENSVNKSLQLDEEISELEQMVQVLESGKKSALEDKGKLHDQLSKLRDEVEYLKKDNEKLRGHSDEKPASDEPDPSNEMLKKENSKLFEENKKLSKDLSDLKSELENLEKSKINPDVKKLQKQLNAEKEKVNSLEKTIDDISAKHDKLRKNNEKYKETVAVLNKDIDDYEQDLFAKEKEVEKILAEKTDLEARLEAFQRENDNSIKDCKDLAEEKLLDKEEDEEEKDDSFSDTDKIQSSSQTESDSEKLSENELENKAEEVLKTEGNREVYSSNVNSLGTQSSNLTGKVDKQRDPDLANTSATETAPNIQFDTSAGKVKKDTQPGNNKNPSRHHGLVRPTLRSTLVCKCDQCVRENAKLERIKIKYFGPSD